jgi:hypothetical protein
MHRHPPPQSPAYTVKTALCFEERVATPGTHVRATFLEPLVATPLSNVMPDRRINRDDVKYTFSMAL